MIATCIKSSANDDKIKHKMQDVSQGIDMTPDFG